VLALIIRANFYRRFKLWDKGYWHSGAG